MEDVPREQVVAFRLATHNLTAGAGSVVEAAAPCGIQETPTGSAELAFLARVDGLTRAALDQALTGDRTLVSLWSVRGAPYVVPADDLAVFTVGALPLDAASFRQSLGGWSNELAAAGLDPVATLDQMVAVARDLLDGRTLDVDDLRDQVYAGVPALATVARPSGAHADMPEPLYRALGTTGTVCIVAGRGTDAELARTDQWLGSASSPAGGAVRSDEDGADESGRTAARAELARRFLHCYGPATPQHFADWTQRSLRDAKDAVALLADELAEVAVDGQRRWILARDREALASPPQPTGTRLLPVQDPFLQQRDRATLVPDETSRRRLWRPVRGPGAVLVDGEVVGTWRSRTNRSRLAVTVEPFAGRLTSAVRDAVITEAERVGVLRGCATTTVDHEE